MPTVEQVKFSVGRYLKKNYAVQHDLHLKSAEGDPHAALLFSLSRTLQGDVIDSNLKSLGLKAVWAPFEAVWKPVSTMAKAAKEVVKKLIKAVSEGNAEAASGSSRAVLPRQRGTGKPTDVAMEWVLIVGEDGDVALMARGKVVRDGRTRYVAVAVVAAVNAEGVPIKFVVSRLKVEDDTSSLDEMEKDEAGFCFVSSACARARGLPDDCEELRTLRRFRDCHVATRQDGAAVIARYYADAPALVRRIQARPDAAEIWSDLFDRLVAPAVALIRAGRQDEAFDTYRRVVESFARMYPEPGTAAGPKAHSRVGGALTTRRRPE